MSSSGTLFILSAPAGTGKTTLVDMLCTAMPNVMRSVSCTTRPPRENEEDGVDYHFISREAFEARIKEGDFLEHAEVFGNLYGTSKSFVEEKLAEGKSLFLVIDTQGALQLMKKIRGVYIFVSPPSREEQRKRLKKRSTESEAMIEERLKWSEHEMAQAVHYDYQIVNRDLETAYEELKKIVDEHAK